MNLGYEISRGITYNRRLVVLRNTLAIELEHLQSLDRIEKIAKKELGLNFPSNGQAIVIP